jgi:hypothetical protein
MKSGKQVDLFAGLTLSKEWAGLLQADLQWKAQEWKARSESPLPLIPPVGESPQPILPSPIEPAKPE